MIDKQFLQGHKRVGKRFIPPIMQLPLSKEMSYINDIFPELVWIGLIFDQLDYIKGSRFFEKIVMVGMESAGSSRNYALLSHVAELNSDEREKFLNILSNESILESLQEYIAPLNILYEECPLGFIGVPKKVYKKEQLIESMRFCVDHYIDKYKTSGIVLNGMMLLARLVTGTIKFSSNIEIPDFNAIINDPLSEEAKHAAGFIRSSGLAEFGMLKIDNTWARSFWNKNFELSKCEFGDHCDG